MSNVAVALNELVAEQIKPLYDVLAKMEKKIDELEGSNKKHESEREEWTKEKNEMKETIDMLELSLKKENAKRQDVELRVLRNELGQIGGAGHFWRNDKAAGYGGERDGMGEEELKQVLRLLEAGEKKINLKEREFRTFFNEKKDRNSKKVFNF